MHRGYFDEPGNSGNNLNDPEQPFFVLGADRARDVLASGGTRSRNGTGKQLPGNRQGGGGDAFR